MIDERLGRAAAEEEKMRKKLAEEQKQDVSDEDLVIQRMGYFKYYLLPWLREKERARIARINAINQQLEDV